MADCIHEQITASLESALGSASTYPGNVNPTVERERGTLNIAGRYPFVELGGPYAENDVQTYKIDMTDLRYVVKYYVNMTDENTVANTELPYLTRNVCADLQKAVMVDPSRGNLAHFTRVTDSGYDFDLDANGDVQFYRYLVVQVRVRVDSDDPYQLG